MVVSGNIPNKTLTAPVFISQLTSSGNTPDAAAIATLLFALSFAVVLVTERLTRQREAEA